MSKLQELLLEGSAIAAPKNILKALDVEIIGSCPQNTPHSIYEELWHMDFWQRILLERSQGKEVSWPEHAAEGWPSSSAPESPEVWQALQERFFSDLERAHQLAGVSERLAESTGHTTTRRDWLEDIAVHNAYHLGRIVFLRQLLGVWSPSLGDTW